MEKHLHAGGIRRARIPSPKSFPMWRALAPGWSPRGPFPACRTGIISGPERSLSNFDSRQRLTVSYVLDLPVGTGKRFLAGAGGWSGKLVSGWGIDGVSTFQEGFPLGLRATPNVTGFTTGLRPDVAANCNKNLGGSAQSRLNAWFNTACFSVPGAYTFGGESRTDPNLPGTALTISISPCSRKRRSLNGSNWTPELRLSTCLTVCALETPT